MHPVFLLYVSKWKGYLSKIVMRRKRAKTFSLSVVYMHIISFHEKKMRWYFSHDSWEHFNEGSEDVSSDGLSFQHYLYQRVKYYIFFSEFAQAERASCVTEMPQRWPSFGGVCFGVSKRGICTEIAGSPTRDHCGSSHLSSAWPWPS